MNTYAAKVRHILKLTPDGRDPASGLIIDHKAYGQAWRKKNPRAPLTDEQKKQRRDYYHANHTRMRAAQKKWHEKNRA